MKYAILIFNTIYTKVFWKVFYIIHFRCNLLPLVSFKMSSICVGKTAIVEDLARFMSRDREFNTFVA